MYPYFPALSQVREVAFSFTNLHTILFLSIQRNVHIVRCCFERNKEHNILLYKIGDLFIEVYYSKWHNIITKFYPFSKNELLDIYSPKKLIL
jgi:hypothetical protein